jgi:hypothetical protein
MLIYALLGLLSLLFGGVALLNIASDIQITIALVAISNGFLFFGIGEVCSRLNRIQKNLPGG